MSSAGRGAVYREGGAYYTPPRLAHACVGAVAELWRGACLLEPSGGGGAFVQAAYAHGLAGPGRLEVMDIDPTARALHMPGPHLRTVAATTDDPVQTGFLVTDPQRRPDAVLGNPPYGVPRPDEACARCGGGGRVRVTARQTRMRRAGYLVGGLAPCPTCEGTGWRTFGRCIPVAQLHVERALEVSSRWVLQLMRLAMLESDERLTMWRTAPLRTVYIIPRRPDFMAVCPICAGTEVQPVPGCWDPPTCATCAGTGRVAHGGSGDSAAYGAFLFDHQHRGPPTFDWLTW